MAAWRLMTPMADRLEILLLIQQHNERCPAPNQQISLNLTEDEKYRLKILEEEQDSIKRNHNEVQGQAYFLFTFLDEVLGFNPKIRSYDRHNFITATKELLRNLEEEKLEDEKKDRAAKRAILRAKAMAEDANVPDSLEQTAEQSYREAVKKVEASGKRMPRKSQNPGDVATTTKTSPTTNGNKTGGKKVEDFMSSPTKSKHNVPYPAGQSDCQSSKENINAVSPAPKANTRPLKPALKRWISRQPSQSSITWIPQRVADNPPKPKPMTERERFLLVKQQMAHEVALRLHSEVRVS